MKKLILIILSIASMFILSSCGMVTGDIEDKINPPGNNLPPVLGKWVIEERLDDPDSEEESNIGKEALFHKDSVVIGYDFTTEPSFKIKYVDTLDYFVYKYKTNPQSLGIEKEKVEVITVFNDNKFFQELIRVSENTMLINIEDTFYTMKRTVEEVSIEEVQRYIDVEKTRLRTLGTVEEGNIRTGVLLGLKTPVFDEANRMNSWDYKTIWINSENNRITGIYEMDKLLLPRKNGFWILDVKRNADGESVWDEIITFPKDPVIVGEDKIKPSILKNILYVGSDYISLENIDLDRNFRRTLQIYAIDNLHINKPLTLTQLIGEEGKEVYNEAAKTVLPTNSGMIPNETSIGIARRNGYWVFNGRVNHRENEEELYKDFGIRAIPPKEMVNYDELIIPWEAIKSIIPDAIDVFSSPNDEFVIVITSSHMILYNVEDGNIINDPAAKINIPYDSSIIMSEWAVGQYVDIWESEVIKNGGVKTEN